MSWVKIDDQFPYHRKVIAAGLEGRALYITALCYTAQQLTEGFIPEAVMPLLGVLSGVADVKQTASKLVEVCLWHACEGGYTIHDYLDYNPTKEQVIKTREARSIAGSYGGTHSAEAKRQAKLKQTPSKESSKIQPRTRTPSPIISSKEDSTPKEWMDALYKLCGVDIALASSGMRKRISETGKALIASGAKLEDVERFGIWWLSDEWRAKNTPTPTPEKVRDNWSKMNGNGRSNGNTAGRAKEPEYTPEELARAARINAERKARREAGNV